MMGSLDWANSMGRRADMDFGKSQDFAPPSPDSAALHPGYVWGDVYAITVVFVTLDSPELCIARIQERVSQGGHPVPDADVRRRFGRARRLFWHLYRPLADSWQLFSNTGDGFDLIAAGAGSQVIEAAPDELAQFLTSLE